MSENQTTVDKMFPIQDVTGADMAFGGDIKKLLPPYDSIPKEFRNLNSNSKWQKFFEDWFFSGIEDLKLTPKSGVDPQKALRHLRAIVGSWAPKHEHKTAAVAYLASQWFDDISYKRIEKKPVA